jgi:hypothetical protein
MVFEFHAVQALVAEAIAAMDGLKERVGVPMA